MTIETSIDTVHVFAVALPMADAVALAADAERLSDLLGAAVDASRVEALDTTVLAELGLTSYLIEGEGLAAGPVRADGAVLNGRKGPVLILRPRAVAAALTPQEPLAHMGSYRLDRPAVAAAPLRSASAEGSAAAVPPEASPARNDRRSSGMVAMGAILVALLVALVMWLVAI